MNKEKALKNQGLEFREDISFYGGLLSSGNDVTEQVKKCFVKIVEQS